MRELGQELGFLVVLEVDVVLRKVDLETSEGGRSADLRGWQLDSIIQLGVAINVHACPEPVRGWCKAYRETFLRR